MLTRDILKALSGFSGILPIVFFLFFLKRNKEGKLWVIFVYVLLSLFTDIVLGSMPKNSPEKFYIFSLFTAIEYALFSIFLYLNLNSKKLKMFVLLAAPLFYGLVVYFFFKGSHSNDFDSIPASLESMLMIIFCVCFFYEQLTDMENPFVLSKTFWIIVAILIYMSGVFFLFISSEFFTQEQRKAYWFINFISNTFKHILLTIAFIIPNQKHKKTEPDRSFDELFQKPAI